MSLIRSCLTLVRLNSFLPPGGLAFRRWASEGKILESEEKELPSKVKVLNSEEEVEPEEKPLKSIEKSPEKLTWKGPDVSLYASTPFEEILDDRVLKSEGIPKPPAINPDEIAQLEQPMTKEETLDVQPIVKITDLGKEKLSTTVKKDTLKIKRKSIDEKSAGKILEQIAEKAIKDHMERIGKKPGFIESTIRMKLQSTFAATHLDIINESYMHNVPVGSETHFKVVVVSEKFDGMPLIKRHRMVNDVLKEELKTSIHALSIVAKTPNQWNESDKQVESSPKCKGGFGK